MATDFIDLHRLMKRIRVNLCNPWFIHYPTKMLEEPFSQHNIKMTIEKKWHRKTVSLYLLLLFSSFLTACSGSHQANVPQDGLSDSKTISNDTTASNALQIPTPRVDPLFFVDGQLCAWVRQVFQDKRGDLWFGTNHYGVMRYDGDTLVYFDEDDGLGGGRITGIVEDKEGNVWFGTYRGVTKYDPSAAEKSFTNFTEEDGLVDHEVWSLIIDRQGVFWAGTMEGVSRYDPSDSLGPEGKRFTSFPIPQAAVDSPSPILSTERISCILEDKNGVIWFGTDGLGICRYDPSTAGGEAFTHLTKKEGLCDNNISSMMEDRQGNIWIGTMFGGVSRYDPSASLGSGETPFTNFTEDGVIDGVEVGAFYEDKRGNIWFAAENAGVYCYDGASFTNLYKQEGLVSNGILSILEDTEGRFWFGGWGGLFRYGVPPTDVGEHRDVLKETEKTFFPVTIDGPWQ